MHRKIPSYEFQAVSKRVLVKRNAGLFPVFLLYEYSSPQLSTASLSVRNFRSQACWVSKVVRIVAWYRSQDCCWVLNIDCVTNSLSIDCVSHDSSGIGSIRPALAPLTRFVGYQILIASPMICWVPSGAHRRFCWHLSQDSLSIKHRSHAQFLEFWLGQRFHSLVSQHCCWVSVASTSRPALPLTRLAAFLSINGAIGRAFRLNIATREDMGGSFRWVSIEYCCNNR